MPRVLVALLLAHQGGWDEILLVLAPIAVFAGLLRLANRRADAAASSAPPPGEAEADPVPDREDGGPTA